MRWDLEVDFARGRQVLRASAMRESSPPEGNFSSGFNSSPLLGDTRNAISSMPVEVQKAFGNGDLKLCAAHHETFQFDLDLLAECGGGGCPFGAEIVSHLFKTGGGFGALLFDLLAMGAGVFYFVDAAGDIGVKGENLVDRFAVFALEFV